MMAVDRAELANLYHTARIALAGQRDVDGRPLDTPYQRKPRAFRALGRFCPMKVSSASTFFPAPEVLAADRLWEEAEQVAWRRLTEVVPMDADLFEEGPDLPAMAMMVLSSPQK